MNRIVFAIFITVAGSEFALGQITYYMPHVIAGQTADQTHFWHTDFEITNPSPTQTANVTINTQRANGLPWPSMPYGPRVSLLSTYSFPLGPLRHVSVISD